MSSEANAHDGIVASCFKPWSFVPYMSALQCMSSMAWHSSTPAASLSKGLKVAVHYLALEFVFAGAIDWQDVIGTG